MFIRTINAGLLSGVLALGLSLSGSAMADLTAKEAAALDAKANATLASFKAGFIAGIEPHSMILALNTDKALAKFTSGGREWELGVDASVAVAKISAGSDLDTTNLKRDVASSICGSKGLIADATWEGSRFKKLDVK